MTASSLPYQARNETRVPVSPLNDLRVIRSEWIKLFTLRSTWYILGFFVLSMIGVGAGVAAVFDWRWDDLNPADRESLSMIDVSMGGIAFAQLVVAVLGVQLVTGEYATGMIRASLTAVPRRLMLLRGKVIVSAIVSAVVSIIACVATFFLSQAILGENGAAIGDDGALRAIFGAAFFLVSIAVISTAIGFVTRATAGGIAAVVGLLLVLPVFSGLIPVDFVKDLMDYLPSSAGAALYGVGVESPISPLAGFLALCGWMIVAVIAAAVALQRRDA